MPTATKSPAPATEEHPLLVKRAALIEKYGRTAGAQKASVSTAIGDCEYELELQGVEYDPWEKPSTYKTKWELSEDELVERIGKARALRDDSSKRDLIRARAETDLRKLTAQAERREIKV